MVSNLLPLSFSRVIHFRQHPTMTACWVWTGRRDHHGTPTAQHKGVSTTARRAVWAKLRGELADDERLKARCGFGDCVNPNHMRVRRSVTCRTSGVHS